MNILLLGATGQVGHELRSVLPAHGNLTATARDGSADRTLDVGDLTALKTTLDDVQANVIVNAAAYTAVDAAESNGDIAKRLNTDVPRVLGEWAVTNGALVIHYSTDYVFDGEKKQPYVESDATNPLNEYGRSKLEGETELLGSGCDAIVLRVSWVYGRRGSNFLLTMQRLMAERNTLNIVDDQLGAPTWCRTIAHVTGAVLERAIDAGNARSRFSGVYHLAPTGSTSWYGFAVAIADATGTTCDLNPIPGAAYPTTARRPSNSRLDTHKLRDTFCIALPSWEHELALCLDSGQQ